jgi:hypothetical protein
MSNNKQQTAVEWLIEMTSKLGYVSSDIAEQAKEMDKQQKIDGFVAGNRLEFYDGTEKDCAEQYYNETFGGKL